MTPSKTLFYFCISFIAGIALESSAKIPQIFIWGILISAILCIIFAALCRRSSAQERGFIIGFCLLFLILGVLRMQISEFNIANDKLRKLNGREVVLDGMISAEPDVRSTFQKLKINAQGSLLSATTGRYPEYKYSDKVKITGSLEEPSGQDGDFGYKNYLMKDGIYSVMNFPKVELQDRGRTSVYSYILDFKQKIRQSIRRNFLPPESSILEGTVLGDNGAMSNDLKNKLNITGLRHIIAVSGTHVVILSAIIMYLLLGLGLSRGKAFYIAVIFICLYIIITGMPSSGIRAGIMGGLYLLAQKLGRQTMGSRIIACACAVMLLVNPLLLLYDVGFQLSFLAVMGLIYLEPFIKTFLLDLFKAAKWEIGKGAEVVAMVSTTVAAQAFTLPVMVYNFGNISFVSLITNLLVLPIVSLLMVFGFLTSFAGIFSDILGKILSMPCHFLLLYFVKVIDIFSQPWAVKTIENVHWLWLAVSYSLIVFLVRFLHKKSLRF